MPDERDALAIVHAALEVDAVDARRFRNGLAHYVFDVELPRGRVVARIGERSASFAPALRWHELLRAAGVPVPAVLAHGDKPYPYMLLERLPGSDLGDVHATLTEGEKRTIAAAVAAAQRATAALPPLPGYGYARGYDDGDLAPTWSTVIESILARSRERGRRSGVFDVALVDRVAERTRAMKAELDRIPPTPYLDDATTKNVIVQGGRLSGIVDVDWVGSGDHLTTAALTKVSLVAAGENTSYASMLLAELGGGPADVVALYEAMYALDLLSEMGTRFNRPTPEPVDGARLARLAALIDGD